MMKYIAIILLLFISSNTSAQKNAKPIPAAEFVNEYFPLLREKSIGLLVNQTSVVGNKHLVDTLLSAGMNVKKIFCPEHGFRGNADAGELIENSVDSITQLPIISLYGNKKKPSAKDLEGIELMVFDVQDVGVRFYTYISSLHYLMEACAENKIPLIVLDRPNPNGHYIDGPLLKKEFTSFVGMHPVPIVYGMTIGEYAEMINGEYWLKDSVQCTLTVIPNKNYTHETPYTLPIKPSPNLMDAEAIALYPSLCLFEGTVISMGRGTYEPFKIIGHPAFEGQYDFSFEPQSILGMSKEPPHKNKMCYGLNLSNYVAEHGRIDQIKLQWLIEFYAKYPKKEDYFNKFFDKLAGDARLKEYIKAGKSESYIRARWRKDLHAFKKVRAKYLIYP